MPKITLNTTSCKHVALDHRLEQRSGTRCSSTFAPHSERWPRCARLVGSGQADAGLDQIDCYEPDHERDRGHDLEIDQRLEPHPADLLEVPGARDAATNVAKISGAMII